MAACIRRKRIIGCVCATSPILTRIRQVTPQALTIDSLDDAVAQRAWLLENRRAYSASSSSLTRSSEVRPIIDELLCVPESPLLGVFLQS